MATAAVLECRLAEAGAAHDEAEREARDLQASVRQERSAAEAAVRAANEGARKEAGAAAAEARAERDARRRTRIQ